MLKKTFIVLKALLSGMEIPTEIYHIKMVDNDLYWLMGDRFIPCDMTLGQFIDWCEKMPEDVIVGLAAANVLNAE